MQFCSVTFVLAEAILREPGAKVTHHSVPGYLGDHTGGSYAQTNTVAIDNSSLREGKGNDREPIDQNVLRRVDQSHDRQAHRSMASAQDVDAIDLDRIDNANRPSELWIGHQIQINFLAQFRRKLLGIV